MLWAAAALTRMSGPPRRSRSEDCENGSIWRLARSAMLAPCQLSSIDEEKVRANACTRWLSFSTVARAACGLADDGQHLIGTTIVNTANERMRSSRCSPRNRNLISSEDVEGKEVYDAAGESIGEIDHLMIDKISGRIA